MKPADELLLILDVDGDVPRLEEALTHASYVNENSGTHDYERLEFLGDAVLGLCVTETLLAQMPSASEGRLTRMRAALVNTQALAAFARTNGIARFVRFGRGASASGDAEQPKVLADVVEAIVAAVFLAHGLPGARRLTNRIVGDAIRSHAQIAERDPKSQLQETLQRGGGQVPTYTLVGIDGPDHDHAFEVEVASHGQVLGRGRGRSKKTAEREAARSALALLATRKETP
jgi:ribonuclease-3